MDILGKSLGRRGCTVYNQTHLSSRQCTEHFSVSPWLFMVICVFWSDDLGGLEWYSKGGVAVSLRKVERRIWQRRRRRWATNRICLKRITGFAFKWNQKDLLRKRIKSRIFLRIFKRVCLRRIKDSVKGFEDYLKKIHKQDWLERIKGICLGRIKLWFKEREREMSHKLFSW